MTPGLSAAVDLLSDISSEDGNGNGDGQSIIKRGGCQPRFYFKETADITGKIVKRDHWVEINIPGLRSSQVHQKVTDAHKIDFPAHWAAYMAGKSGVIGTPIDEMPFLTSRQIDELRYYNILTAESLAGLPDTGLQRIELGRQLQAQARAYLQQRAAVGRASKVEEENAQLKAMLQAMSDRLTALETGKKVEPLPAPPPPTPSPTPIETAKSGPARSAKMPAPAG